MGKTETGLFEALEEILKSADRPMSCVEMFDKPEIRLLAASANRVSDYLGGLWRKGKVTRSVAIRNDNDSSRWAYSWRHGADQNKLENGRELYLVQPPYAGNTILKRPNIEITDDGKTISIDLPNLTITIRSKT